MSCDYAELHCISHYTFLRGISSPAELVARAAGLGYRALALTDECSLAGVVKAHMAAKEHNLQLIIGSEFFLDDTTAERACQLLLLAPDKRAYQELSLLITQGRRRSAKGEYQLSLADLQFGTQHCLAIWLPGSDRHEHNDTHAQILSRYFRQRLWLGVTLLQQGTDADHYANCYQLSQQHRIPMLACNQVHMHCRSRQPLQDTVTAIRLGTPVQQLGRQRSANAERHLRPLHHLQQLYPPTLLAESWRLAQRCHFSLDELRHDYPRELVPDSLSASEHLRNLALQGAQQRWPHGTPAKVAQQLHRELQVIAELGYEHYFLTVADVVHFARQQNILCQGRGSAANSVVCFCLFITEVDPEHSSLLFERFISRERNEPPDIDVDFEHERREEVIQYIYRKYSRKRTALTATVISYRLRSAVRDVGKALGLDDLMLQRLCSDLSGWDRPAQWLERVQQQGALSHQLGQRFHSLVQQLLGTPRHLSQHVGGFLMTESPISNLVPVENAAMPERTIIQWDKDDIESLGLLKVDVLALGMLTAIRKTLQLVSDYSGNAMGLADIPKSDPGTYHMLCQGDSMGVFQVESRAQMAMLPRLKPRCYYDLVVQVAIVRPGPIQGDMVHPYLKRRNGEEPVHYPNAAVKGVLERTLGVPIFQEQVIQLAMVAAGFSGGEADQLRRAMASWKRHGDLQRFRQKLIDGMLARGHEADFAERLFNQILGFGDYGFPESHAASFALLVYASAWLKCHHPAAFYCGLLNSLPMGFYSPSQLVQDARRHDIEVRPIDVAHSGWDHRLEPFTARSGDTHYALRLGLRQVKGLRQEAAQRIEQCQQQAPLPDTIARWAAQAQLRDDDLQQLAAASAFAGLSAHRRHAHWQVQEVEPWTPLFQRGGQESSRSDALTRLPAPSDEENTLEDYRVTGLTLNQHPMSLLRQRPAFQRCKRAIDLLQVDHGRFVRIAGVVTGRQRPGTASGALFMTLEDETGNINVILWRALQERQRQEVLRSRVLIIKGVLERKENVVHVIAGHLQDMSDELTQLQTHSRDFH